MCGFQWQWTWFPPLEPPLAIYSSKGILIGQQSAPSGYWPALWQGWQAAGTLTFEQLCKRITNEEEEVQSFVLTLQHQYILNLFVAGRLSLQTLSPHS